ncbi:MAG: iron ABC transporter substrate-binding protein [Kiritimatiellia bacterium]
MVTGCGWQPEAPPQITLYSGRNQHLLAPLLEQFTAATGIRVHARYGGTAELAATILEEGDRSPADVFFAQDAGALGALSQAGRFMELPTDLLDLVPETFRSRKGLWVGTSGRARVIVYNPARVSIDELPDDITDLTDPVWKDRIGWAPLNASFQTFVTALRVQRGEPETRAWLQAMAANRPRQYARNTAILQAVAAGEIDIGLSNHYYLHTMQREQGGSMRARNHVPTQGTLINVAGVGILRTSRKQEHASALVHFLLSQPAQTFFTDQTFEYPLAYGIAPNKSLPPLATVPSIALDLRVLEDLEGSLRILQELDIL